MWTCPKCERVFENTKQMHSCNKTPLDEHFKNKKRAKELFDHLVEQVNKNVGKCRIVSIPCCVHLYGQYDFLAALPKKEKLEIRFALNRALRSPRIKQSVPMSIKVFKNCMDVSTKEEIDEELIKWLNESYFLKG
jgi:hypothetical protein